MRFRKHAFLCIPTCPCLYWTCPPFRFRREVDQRTSIPCYSSPNSPAPSPYSTKKTRLRWSIAFSHTSRLAMTESVLRVWRGANDGYHPCSLCESIVTSSRIVTGIFTLACPLLSISPPSLITSYTTPALLVCMVTHAGGATSCVCHL